MAGVMGEMPGEIPQGEREHAFEFHGSGGEYFRIWIVNFLLSLVTLGIYSAWAKVRTQRYFARSTRLADSSFDYLADPIAILKGRLLVLAFFALYTLVSAFASPLEPLMGLALFLLFPWAIVRSMAFRAHNTAWRNLRFRFDASYGNAFSAYVGLPFLSILTLGLLYPYTVFQQRRFIVDHAAYGTTPFQMGSRTGDFYRLFLRISVVLLGIAMLMGALFASVGEKGLVAAAVLALPLYFYVFGTYAAGVANLTYDGASLGRHRLSADLPAARMAWIYASNALAMLASLGLLVPWAHVRLARCRLQHLHLHAVGDLDAFVAAQAEEVASLGAELGDALDFDLGL